jgi:toxin ParE1/3/4
MDEKCNMLAKWPEMGERREDLAPGLRFFSVGRYVILYRPIDEGIQLVRVLRGCESFGEAKLSSTSCGSASDAFSPTYCGGWQPKSKDSQPLSGARDIDALFETDD